MQKIIDLRPGAGYEVIVQIESIQPIRALWTCFECKKKGLMKPGEIKEVCPECGAVQSPQKSKGVWIQKVTTAKVIDETGTAYLDLWHEDAVRYKVADKLHIMNMFVKANDVVGMKLSKGKYGQIEVMK